MQSPHENEYAGAVAGMNEIYGTAKSLPAVGDFVSGTTCGKRWSGYVLTAEPGRLAIEVSGAWIVVDPADITH
jgi:aspartate 1-decarboxylase